MRAVRSDNPTNHRPCAASLIAGLVAIVTCLSLGGTAAAQPGTASISAGGPYSGQVGSPVVFMSRFDLGGRPPDTG